MDGQGGRRLTFQFGSGGSRTPVPAIPMEIARYVVSGDGPGEAAFQIGAGRSRVGSSSFWFAVVE